MRVTVVGINYSPEPTGISVYTTGAAQGLSAAGVLVRVITGYPHYPQWRIADGYTGRTRRERIAGVAVLRLRHPVPTDGGVVARSLMEAWFGLRSVFASWRGTQVVLAVTPALIATTLVVVKARLTRRPIVVWVQDIYTLSAAQTGAATKAAGVVRTIESWTLRHADRVVVIHDRFAAYVADQLGVQRERIDVVRNWTHLSRPGVRSAQTRAAHGWSDDETIVLHAGNMGAKQNLESVVRASALAAAKHSNVRFVLLGDGHRRAALEALGSNPNLQYLDPLPDEDFAATVASADILLVNELPGMTEMSLPSKLTSYFSTGLPVIAAVDPGSVTAEEIAASQGGVLIAPDDPEALLAAADALAADADTAAALGQAGLAYRRDMLSESAAIDGLVRSLERALTDRRR